MMCEMPQHLQCRETFPKALMRLFAKADPQLVQYFRDGGTVGSDSDPESPGRADPSMLDAQVGSGMDTTLDGI